MAEIRYEWYDASSKFPEDGKEVLVWVRSHRKNVKYTTIAWYLSYNGWEFGKEHNDDYFDVLLWTEKPVPTANSNGTACSSELDEIKENLLNLTTKMNTVESVLGTLKENAANISK